MQLAPRRAASGCRPVRPPVSGINPGRLLRLRNSGQRVLEAAAVEAPAAPPATAADPAKQPAPGGGAQPAGAPEHTSDLFDWRRCWYPIAALEYLDDQKPNAASLLGGKLAIWRDGAGEWRAHDDMCPHRLAPLTEGRIHESGQLQCTYHGWRFDGSGACTSIPQIKDPKAHATACASGRACVKAYPTQVLQGMLWVYGDPSPAGWAEATGPGAMPAMAAPEMVGGGWDLKSKWFQRDIPLSQDVLMENMTDPAHVPQSHHGFAGDRESDQRMGLTLTEQLSKAGFKAAVEAPAGSMGDYTFEFHAPCHVKYYFPGNATMLLYGVPSAMGWTRVYMTMVGPKDSKAVRPPTPQLPWVLNWWIDNVVSKVTWLQHIIDRNMIVDGDTAQQHGAERWLYARGGPNSWPQQYYLPAAADAAVTAWRRWLDKHGAAGPVLPRALADLPPEMSKDQVLDRYNQHTKHCPSCRGALHNVTVAVGVAAVVGVVAAAVAVIAGGAAAAAAAGAGAPAGPLAPLGGLLAAAGGRTAAVAAVVALVAGLLAGGLWKLRELFIYYEYVHADH